MAEAMLGINGEIIRWAREYYNMQPDEAATAIGVDRKSTRLNSSHLARSRMPSSA